jgi:hypothetical protein
LLVAEAIQQANELDHIVDVQVAAPADGELETIAIKQHIAEATEQTAVVTDASLTHHPNPAHTYDTIQEA